MLHLANITTLYDFKQQNSDIFSTARLVSPSCYLSYLSSNQYSSLKNVNFIQLVPYTKPARSKRQLESHPQNYSVQACPNWKPRNSNISVIYNGYDLYTAFHVSDTRFFDEDPCVVDYIVKQPVSASSRYMVGYMQSRSESLEYDGKYLMVPRSLHKAGFTGAGQIVSIFDSGVDYNHDFFYDPENPEIGFFPNEKHRKIYHIAGTYNNDKRDVKGGHGTHVSGILAGKSLKADSATGQYNGMAPDAKIYMHDLAQSIDGQDDPFWGIDYINIKTTFNSLKENGIVLMFM